MQNHERMLLKGYLTEDPFWYFVLTNAPESLYQGYRTSLYGLVCSRRFRLRLWTLSFVSRCVAF